MKDRMPYLADSSDGPRWVAKNVAEVGLASPGTKERSLI
jgi:hypothetical protein